MHTADPEHRVPHLAFQPDQLNDIPFLPMGEIVTSYYLRMRVDDRPGVLADITRILADREISIDAMIQKEPPEGEDQTDIILLTHQTVEKNIVDAIAKIEALPTVRGKIVRIRLEQLTNALRQHPRRLGDAPQPFSAVLLEGLAPDGGLAVPERYPRLSGAELESLRPLGYRDLAFAVLSRFIDDIPPVDLRRIVDATYTREVFGSDAITPLVTLEPGLHLLRVANGPTLAFKDIALQLLGRLFEYALARERRRSTSWARRRGIPARPPNTRCAAGAASPCSCSRPRAG